MSKAIVARRLITLHGTCVIALRYHRITKYNINDRAQILREYYEYIHVGATLLERVPCIILESQRRYIAILTIYYSNMSLLDLPRKLKLFENMWQTSHDWVLKNVLTLSGRLKRDCREA